VNHNISETHEFRPRHCQIPRNTRGAAGFSIERGREDIHFCQNPIRHGIEVTARKAIGGHIERRDFVSENIERGCLAQFFEVQDECQNIGFMTSAIRPE
jgi:hypothetical protein